MRGKTMTDATKELIWELVEPQLEMYDRMNLPVERRMLEMKVLDLIQTIEEQEENVLQQINNMTKAYEEWNKIKRPEKSEK